MPCLVIVEAAICKTPEEIFERNLDLTSPRVWSGNTQFGLGVAIRPASKSDGGRRGVTGAEYSSSGGWSGEKEPQWGPDTVTDGAIVWTRQAMSNASLVRTIASPSDVTWTPPAGVTLTNPVLRNTEGLQQVGILVGGTIEDEDDSVVVAHIVFSNGEELDFGFEVMTHEPAPAEDA